MKFNYSDEFLKDFKKLKKKILSLDEDMKNFEKFVPAVDFDNNKRFVTLLRDDENGFRIIKTRLMVRSLKGSAKTRLVFAFRFHDSGIIDFIEIYLKNKKEREDPERIERWIEEGE